MKVAPRHRFCHAGEETFIVRCGWAGWPGHAGSVECGLFLGTRNRRHKKSHERLFPRSREKRPSWPFQLDERRAQPVSFEKSLPCQAVSSRPVVLPLKNRLKILFSNEHLLRLLPRRLLDGIYFLLFEKTFTLWRGFSYRFFASVSRMFWPGARRRHPVSLFLGIFPKRCRDGDGRRIIPTGPRPAPTDRTLPGVLPWKARTKGECNDLPRKRFPEPRPNAPIP